MSLISLITRREKCIEYARRYRERHPARAKAATAKWAAANREKIRARVNRAYATKRPKMQEQARLYRAKNLDKFKAFEHRHRLKGYGLTETTYAEMVAAQDNRCAICRTSEPGGKGTWCIDHDHDTGIVRGLLCVLCNLHLHAFEKKTAEAEVFWEYLTKAANKKKESA